MFAFGGKMGLRRTLQNFRHEPESKIERNTLLEIFIDPV